MSRSGDDEGAIRMTARVQEIEPGVIEADYTIEPPIEADADAEYVRRFATRRRHGRGWKPWQASTAWRPRR